MLIRKSKEGTKKSREQSLIVHQWSENKLTSGFPYIFFLNFKDLGSTWLFVWSSNKQNLFKYTPTSLCNIFYEIGNKNASYVKRVDSQVIKQKDVDSI